MSKLRALIPIQEASVRHAAGESLRSLAAAYGVNPHTLSKHLKRHSLPVRTPTDARVLSLKQHPRKKPYKGGQKAASRTLYENKKAFIRDHRVSLGCQDCGENHPSCLDLHHLDPATKHPHLKTRMLDDGTGRRTYKGWLQMSYDDIEAELQKCVVLCSNCHKKRHWKEEPI
jgi:hypothetical protein